MHRTSEISASNTSAPHGSGLGWLFYAVVGLLLWPVFLWGYLETFASEQNLQAVCLLALLGIYLIYLNRTRMRPVWDFDGMSIALLGGGIAGILCAGVWHRPEFMLVAFCLSLASFTRFTFGAKARRVYYALLGGFVLYLVFILIYPLTNFQLSFLSAHTSNWALARLDVPFQLKILEATGRPHLLFILDGKYVSVLSPAKGFGLLSASLLVSFILLLYRKTPAFAAALWLLWAVAFAFLINVARIVLTMLLTRDYPERFLLIHEMTGLAAFYLIIWAQWYLLAGWPLRAQRA